MNIDHLLATSLHICQQFVCFHFTGEKKFCDNTMEKKFLLLQGVRFVPLCCDIPDLFQCTIDKKGIGTLLTVFFDLLGIDVDKTCSKRLCVTL